MWVTGMGHGACTYEFFLNNVYILQSRSVSINNYLAFLNSDTFQFAILICTCPTRISTSMNST